MAFAGGRVQTMTASQLVLAASPGLLRHGFRRFQQFQIAFNKGSRV